MHLGLTSRVFLLVELPHPVVVLPGLLQCVRGGVPVAEQEVVAGIGGVEIAAAGGVGSECVADRVVGQPAVAHDDGRGGFLHP